jgi:hypothetical protein
MQLVVQDVIQYVMHRLEHMVPIIYAHSHKPHHRFTNPTMEDAFNGSNTFCILDSITLWKWLAQTYRYMNNQVPPVIQSWWFWYLWFSLRSLLKVFLLVSFRRSWVVVLNVYSKRMVLYGFWNGVQLLAHTDSFRTEPRMGFDILPHRYILLL